MAMGGTGGERWLPYGEIVVPLLRGVLCGGVRENRGILPYEWAVDMVI